jgi:adenosylcobyric acid synthase
MERRLGLPCLGVVPYVSDLGLDEEDGVALEDRALTVRRWQTFEAGPTRPLRIGVIALPHMANFTDFDPLALEPSVSLAFIEHPEETAAADLLILPGSKQTLNDLEWLGRGGFVPRLRSLYESGIPLIGICGGFQMLGSSIEDPQGIESQGEPSSRKGLGFLPVRTVLHREKTVRRVEGCLRPQLFGLGRFPENRFQGYEIHVGETLYESGSRPLADIVRTGISGSIADGAISVSGRVLGTYVHGLFDGDDFRHAFLAAARRVVGLAPAQGWVNVAAEREARIDRLADRLRKSLEISLIRSWIVAPPKR